jgi:hypothetical protein
VKSYTYLFHMIGGQTIRVPNVTFLSMTIGEKGRWVGYKIEWAEGKRPPFSRS